MKKILSLLCAVIMVASLACLSAFAADPAVTVSAVAHEVAIGDNKLAVDIVMNVPADVEINGFKYAVSYDAEKMALAEEPEFEIKGNGVTSQTIDVNPYALVWAGIGKQAIKGTGEDILVLTLNFELKAAAVEGAKYDVTIAAEEIKDSNGASIQDSAVIENANVVVEAPVVTAEAPATSDDAPATSAEAPVATETEAPAATTTAAPATTKAPDKASQTGDMMFVVVAVMVVALGAAVVVKKVNVK